jgi:radical SAM superfamily enzyme YgiQ (UPF0313 family)
MDYRSGVPLWDSETSTIRKNWNGRISIALVYPNTYSVGMANLGFQSVYRLLNGFDDLVCERVFLPESGSKHMRPVSVESGRPLKDFRIVAFSVSFENDYPNVLNILDYAGLPLQSHARGDSHPLLIAGGVACLLNPEPLSSFIDCFLIGEGEALFDPFVELLRHDLPKSELLEGLAVNVPGAYVPAFYDASYHPDGTLASFNPNRDVPKTVKRVFPADLSMIPSSTAVMSSASAFESSFLTEVSRGCSHGCRFCSAGYIYRPPRTRSRECLMDEFRKGASMTDRIGLVGTAISDHDDIREICLLPEFEGLRFSYSSLRADSVSPGHLAVLSKSGTKTATIAPDAGSERMRRVINKGITESQILEAAASIVKAGIPNIKLYFMIGLPGENDSDIDGIISLTRKIKHVFLEESREKGRMGQITVGISSFVPKASTPFQWAAMDDPGILKKKLKHIKSCLNAIPNIHVNTDNPRGAVIQALLSRGDRFVSDLLMNVHQNQGNWVKSFKESRIDTTRYIHVNRNQDELFPWDFIDHGILKSFLWDEYQKALNGESTPPCPFTAVKCNICGACSGI